MSDLQKIKELLQSAVDKKNKGRFEEERTDAMKTMGRDLVQALTPVLKEIAKTDRTDEIIDAIQTGFASLETPNITVEVPDIPAPIIPKIEVPRVTVNVPPIKIPDISMPDEMNIKGWVGLMGVDLNNPLPVQLRDSNGKPVNLFENLTQIIAGGGGGGKSDFFTIKTFAQSAFSQITNADGRVRVELPAGGSGLTDTELRTTAVPVSQVSGAGWSTSVTEIFGSTIATGVLNADNRIRVSLETGGSGLTDSELRATAIPVSQVSGANFSVYVTDIFGSTITSSVLNADNRLRVSLETGGSGLTDTELRATAVPVTQVSGASWSTSAAQSGTWNIGTVTGVTNSIAASLTDSSGVQYSGSNPVPVSVGNTVTVSVSGSIASVVAVGSVVAGVADDGSAPVQSGGIARTANPTPVAGGNVVKSTHDKIGRQVMRPVQVRDLISSAYVSIANGTETTLLAGVAASYLDLVYVMGTNNSDVAVTVDIRSVTAGNIQTSIRIPANGTAGISLPIPIPQDETGNNWTADLPDITGTTVTLSALFSKEV